MRTKTKKATFNLHVDVLAALDEVVTKGGIPSKNALVEQALLKELKSLQKQQRREQWQKGAKDTLLLKDVTDTETAFKFADSESARRIG